MLKLSFEDTGGAIHVSGDFTVQALDMVQCPADPDPNDNSTPGCRGSDITTLLTVTIENP